MEFERATTRSSAAWSSSTKPPHPIQVAPYWQQCGKMSDSSPYVLPCSGRASIFRSAVTDFQQNSKQMLKIVVLCKVNKIPTISCFRIAKMTRRNGCVKRNCRLTVLHTERPISIQFPAVLRFFYPKRPTTKNSKANA